MALTIAHDVLLPAIIAEIRRWIAADEVPMRRCNLNSWPAELVRLSGAILIRDIGGPHKAILLDALREFLPHGVDPALVSIMHHYAGRLAYIPWHDDDKYALSMTVYLNERWDRDWAGYLIVDEGDGKLRAIAPVFNTAVIFEPPMMHCMTMPALEAPLRESLQVFVMKEPKP